jgi:hypothetical protein
MAAGKPVLYHVISRVVDRRFVLGTEEKEKFRTLMRMQENFISRGPSFSDLRD